MHMEDPLIPKYTVEIMTYPKHGKFEHSRFSFESSSNM